MNKIILYIFLLASIANAKKVYINFKYDDATGPEAAAAEQVYWIVDPDIKMLKLKNFLFEHYKLSFDKYALAEKSTNGFKAIDECTPIGQHGGMAGREDDITLYIVAKQDLSSADK